MAWVIWLFQRRSVRGATPIRHPGENRDPFALFDAQRIKTKSRWIPAFAGMTV
jgi:hypothetical protein